MNLNAPGGSLGRRHRATARTVSLALATMGLAAVGAGTAAPAQAASVGVTDASFTWGLSGYAQVGAFAGPWTIKDTTGDAAELVGSVSGGSQTEYVVAPVPATSMPASEPQKTPNAVRFTTGTGTADPATGAASLAWEGSYTVNAYPPQFGAPDEIYTDPELTLAADGSGTLTMDVTIGAGEDMEGNPTDAVDLGRLTILSFAAAADQRLGVDAFRVTPTYQGTTVDVPEGGPAQSTSCTTEGAATGWWGAWSQDLVTHLPEAVRPHFYSTGCGGLQDNKPPLPLDVDFGVSADPEVTVSADTFFADGSYTVQVTGTGFAPAAATGSRPPLSGKPAGTYVVFGKFAEAWRPSTGALSATRKNSSQKWAVLAEDMATIGGDAGGAVELTPDGSFSATLTVDKAAIDAIATDPSLVNYGIYTYPGSGGVNSAYETYTPITFVSEDPSVTVSDTDFLPSGAHTVTVTGSNFLPSGATGSRPPLSGKPAGTYVVFGKFAEAWRPSTGALSATRKNSSQKWAVLAEDMATIGGNAGGAVELTPDGSFSATLTVDKAAIDAIATDPSLINYGIYTYPGSGGTQAKYETYTPVTFTQATPAVTVTAPRKAFGQPATARVIVPGATGSVTLERGTTVVGTAALVEGATTFDLGKLAVGSYPLTASYEGSVNHLAGVGTTRLTVTKATPRTSLKVTTKPTRSKQGAARASVLTPAGTAIPGTVKVVLRSGSGKLLRTYAAARINPSGAATVRLPRLGKGGYKLVLTYAGNASYTAASRTVTFRVG